MSELELRRKERLVLSIKARIGQLVYAVQDDEAHIRFEPGCCWWISSLGASARKQYPHAVHFCEQIEISQEDFEFALGRKWLSTFSALRSRKVRYLSFVTVDLINHYSDYGSTVESPASKSSLIVSSSLKECAKTRADNSSDESTNIRMPGSFIQHFVVLLEHSKEHRKVGLVTIFVVDAATTLETVPRRLACFRRRMICCASHRAS